MLAKLWLLRIISAVSFALPNIPYFITAIEVFIDEFLFIPDFKPIPNPKLRAVSNWDY